LSGASLHRLYYGPDTHSDALVLGCLFALLWRRGWRIPQLAGWLGLASLLAGYAFIPHTAGAVAYGTAPMAIAAILLVGAALDSGPLPRGLSCRPLVALGVISYSVSLWHLFVFSVLDYRDPLVAAVLTLALASLTYHKVEKPLRQRARARRTPLVETQPVAPEAHPAPAQA